jgi:hypothetical protein
LFPLLRTDADVVVVVVVVVVIVGTLTCDANNFVGNAHEDAFSATTGGNSVFSTLATCIVLE